MASVLVVDDESMIRQILIRWLERDGHEVREAENADLALQTMAARPADVVFCDIQMPGHDGRWLTGELRARYPGTAVILATADVMLPPVLSLQDGVQAYVVKPFSRSAILAAAQRGVAWHQSASSTAPGAGRDPDEMKAWLESLD